MTTYWTTSSTSTSTTSGTYTYTYRTNPYQSWFAGDCAGVTKATIRFDDSAEKKQKKKEAELQKAFDEVFDGQ